MVNRTAPRPMCQSRNVLSSRRKNGILVQVFAVGLVHLLPFRILRPREEPKDVAPPAAIVRRVRIALLVAEAVVLAMHGDPGDRRTFAGQRAQQAEQAADPAIGLKTAVRQKAMIAQANAQAAADPRKNAEGDQADPGKAKRRGQRADVHEGAASR